MARKKTDGKAEKPEAAAPVKFSLQLPADLARRFGVHAEMTGASYSELFAEMVQAHCRRFVVHDHQARTRQAGDAGEGQGEDAA